jgi:hypothetical protein
MTKAVERMFPTSERTGRIARMLYAIVQELQPGARTNVLPLARGIALHTQLLKLSPAAFDVENGRDALTAIALAHPISELVKAARSNARTLNAQWAKVVNLVDYKLPPDKNTSWRNLRDSGDMSEWPPKLFDGFVPDGK